MSEEPKSIWKRPFRGWLKILIWFGLLAIVFFIAFWCMNAALSNREEVGFLGAGALIISAALLGLIFFIRWLCNWRNLRRFLFVVACLVTLIVLILSEENWRGKRAWENHKRVWEAKGEKFSFAELTPPPVPDDKNFAMSPLLKPIFDFEHATNGVRWLDTNGIEHIRGIRADLSSGTDQDKLVLGSLEKGTFTDLEACRDFYRGNTNYPQPKKSETAAQDVLVALGKFDADLAELHEAAVTRPYSRFPISYDEEPPWGILLVHLSYTKGFNLVVQLRAIARLDAGQTNAAFDDVVLGFRLSDSISNEPLLIDHLVRIATLSVSLQSVREGLHRHAWTDSQLRELEERLASLNLLAEFKLAMRGERVCSTEGLNYLRRRGSVNLDDWAGGWLPVRKAISVGLGGLFYQNMLAISEMHQKYTLGAVDEKARRVDVETSRSAGAEVAALEKGFHPYRVFVRMLFPAVTKAILKTAWAQTSVDEARMACALERYRIANGQFPENLESLVPQFIDAIPDDVIDGKPLRYHQTADGGYVVYSVGWNEKDDGGVVMFKKGSSSGVDAENGDWVWQMPGK